MRLCFNLSLPDRDLYRVGSDKVAGLEPVDYGGCVIRNANRVPSQVLVGGMGSGLEVDGRSYKGYAGREFNRFFPLLICLEALVRVNEWHYEYATNGQLPPLYKSGVRYQEEPPGEEEWLDYPSVLKQRWGDCEDLAAARTGELRWFVKEPAVCSIRFKDFKVDGQLITLVHVLTLRASGYVEDPSKVLGMGGNFNHSV